MNKRRSEIKYAWRLLGISVMFVTTISPGAETSSVDPRSANEGIYVPQSHFNSANEISSHSSGSSMIAWEESNMSVTSSEEGLPTPFLRDTISLHADNRVMQLTYSPDGKFLAIAETPLSYNASIVIWNISEHREQAIIPDLNTYAKAPARLLWSPDNRYLTFGIGSGPEAPMKCWDPMTGKLLQEVPLVGTNGHFNQDGTKLLVRSGDAEQPTIRIYDTATWNFQELEVRGLGWLLVAWGADGNVIAFGNWNVRGAGVWNSGTLPIAPDGTTLGPADAVAFVIDPSKRSTPKTILISPALRSQVPGISRPVFQPTIQFNFLAEDSSHTHIAAGLGLVLDTKTLNLMKYADSSDIIAGKIPAPLFAANVAMSPDGQFLFLKGAGLMGNDNQSRSLILDTRTGLRRRWIDGGHDGIAISPNGKEMAIGQANSVQIYDLR